MTDEGRVALYVAVPITSAGKVRGVSYASSTTFSIMTLLRDYRLRMALVVLLFAAITFVMTELLTRWLSRPLQSLSATAKTFAGGDHTVRARPDGSSETRALAEAFNAMGDEVQHVVTELKEEERRKSRFVSDVSHELRTPLTAIRGAAETLLEGDVPEDDARQFLVTVIRESDRLTRLANDLLTLQRIEGATGELPLRRIDLRATAERAIGALAPLTDARGVEVTVEGTTPTVLGDVDRLQQVIANLVDNATRMTQPGAACRFDCPTKTTVQYSLSLTRDQASRRMRCRTCSSASTARRRAGTAPPAAPVWVSPSSTRSRRRTRDRSRRPTGPKGAACSRSGSP